MANMPPTPPESHFLPVRVEAAPPAPYPYAEQQQQHSGEADARRMIRRLLTAVIRHRWAVIGMTILGSGAGYAASRYVHPVYRAQGSLWIEVAPEQGRDRGPIRSGPVLESFGWVELLESFAVLDNVVRDQRLYLSTPPADSGLFASFHLAERFAPGSYRLDLRADGTYELKSGPTPVGQGRIGDSIGAAVGFRWRPTAELLKAPRTIDFSVSTPRDAATGLAGALNSHMDQNGTFLRVWLEGTDPTRLASTVNAVLERHVVVAADLKREKLTELSKILYEQLQYAARNLAAAERALEGYRIQIITLPQEDRSTPMNSGLQQTRDPVFTNFFDMNVRREQLRRDRESIERAIAEAGGGPISADALTIIGEVQQSADVRAALGELVTKQAELRSLRYRYSDAHPLVKQRAAEVDTLGRQTIPTLARQLAAQISTRERELSGRVTSASRELERIPPRAMEEARLSREKTIAENLYTTLQARFEVALLAEASSIPDVLVLERAAVPRWPVKNNKMRLLLLGFVGGFGIAVAGAVLRDRLDPRLRYPEQVTTGMGLSILGAVPHVRKNGKSQTDALQVLEALRGVRLNLTHAYGSAGPLVVTVTSPGSGDGKSFISSNLALSFADNGARTLLIDGDVRRGRLHALMNVTRKPGLTDCLTGDVSREKIVHQTNYPLLSIVSCGTRRRNGPELLSSPAMSQLLATMRSSYDVIIVDSPPLGAGVDPFVLGTLTGHLLLVLRTGVTDREYTEAKLDMLDRLPVRVLGAVLNDVRAGDAYGYYSYYTYLPGYDAVEEREPEPARQLPNDG
jgi:capsular exopolysaccharide synthesis family protein